MRSNRRSPRPGRRPAQTALLPFLAVCGALLGSCNNEALPSGPNSPQGAAERILTSMSGGHMEIVWDEMPPSWQADVEALRNQLATQTDPALYDGAVETLRVAVEVLEQKRDFVIGLPMIPPASRPQMAVPYEASLDMLKELLASPLGSHGRLQTMDIRSFLESTVSVMAKRGRQASEMVPMLQPPPDMTNVDFQFLGQEGERALVGLNYPDGRMEKEIMTRIEDKWVPEALALDWDDYMAQARTAIETWLALPADQVAAQRERLDKTRRHLQTLQLSKSQAEFNANFGVLMSLWR